ncbi:hypothetical protein KY290_033175 [Solanum tuberosum]|uniref:At1g61320/AtMIF1 LRR domain-containing protein n=1 Tax=Solanum tuberosum TaxID=4113 RepID=A0ABQ7U1E3_SOLTU|nr:hypothetical protein KY289_032546 [Solanum tuberosum]KAH0740132.1 hypothetical protein KY290_033175 [Solanum tuberosum]
MIFNAKALNVLRLIGFNIIELPCKSINLPSLREFYLDSVILDDNFLRAICTTCSNLEVLYLVGCHGFNSLQVGENLPKLKKLKLEYSYHQVQFVDISSTNLEQITIYGNCDYLKAVEITASKALKTLYLQRVPITQKILSCLGNLDKCELFFCHTLKTLKIASFLLKQLTVHQCPNLIAVELDTPNLIRFSYNCHSLPTLQLKASASASLEAKNCFVSGTTDSDVTKFLGNFNQSMVVELTCKSDKALAIPKDMRGNLLPPLYGTNRVHVNIRSPLINCSIVDILDSMLWISPQLDTISYCKPDLKVLMFIYEDEMPCCTSQPWKCWRPKLKQVKIQNITCMEQKQELRNYLYANTDIPEIIEVPGPVFIDPTVFIHRFVIG